MFVQYKIAWHAAPVSRWKNDFMYAEQPCDFVVICISFCVETLFSFFVFLLYRKTKPNPSQLHRINTIHLTPWLQLKVSSQLITSHTVFLMLFQQLPFFSSTPGNLYFSSLQVLNWFQSRLTSHSYFIPQLVCFSSYLTKGLWNWQSENLADDLGKLL